MNNNKVTTTTNYLYRIIQTILCFCLNDRTICEELSRHFNRYCLQIINYIPTSSDDNDKNYDDDADDDDDPIYEIQDLIGELISIFTMHSIEFPCSECCRLYTIDELQLRLSLWLPFIMTTTNNSNNNNNNNSQKLLLSSSSTTTTPRTTIQQQQDDNDDNY